MVASGTENGDEAHDDDIVTKFGAIVAERKNSKVVHYVENQVVPFLNLDKTVLLKYY